VPLFDTAERFFYEYGKILGYTLIAGLTIFMWGPIFVLTFMSFAEEEVLQFPPSSLSLEWYARLPEASSAMGAMMNSIQVALIVAPVAVVLALLAAYPVYHYDFKGKGLFQLVLTLPLIVPLIVTGTAMVLFFGIANIRTGFWAVVAAHLVRTLPFAFLIILPAFYSFDDQLTEASRDLGADEVETFLFVTLPNIAPSVIASGILAFTISLNEVIYTFFVRNSEMLTLPVYIYQRLQQQATPMVNVVSVVFVSMAIGLVLLSIGITNIERIVLRE
jgi:spermidine/putrescine transport system permease protein